MVGSSWVEWAWKKSTICRSDWQAEACPTKGMEFRAGFTQPVRLQGIDPGRPPGRKCCSYGSDGEHQGGHHHKGEKVGGRHAVKKGSQKASQQKRGNNAAGDAIKGNPHPLRQDHGKNSPPRGSDSYPIS